MTSCEESKEENVEAKVENKNTSKTFGERLKECEYEFYKNQRLVLLNLPKNVTPDAIRKFVKSDKIEHIHINKKRLKSIITLSDGYLADKFAKELNEAELEGHKITACVSQPDNTLCISGLPLSMDSEKLRRELKHYGRLEKCFVLPDEQFGNRGLAVIQFGLNLEKTSNVKFVMSKVVFDKMRISCDFLPYEVAKFEQLNSCVILLKNLPSDFKDRKALEEEARTMGQPIYCQLGVNEGKPLGFAVIEYSVSSDALTAWRKFHETKLFGDKSKTTVHLAIPGKTGPQIFNSQISIRLRPVNNGILPEPRSLERERRPSDDFFRERVNRAFNELADRERFYEDSRGRLDDNFQGRRASAYEMDDRFGGASLVRERTPLEQMADHRRIWQDPPLMSTQNVKPLMDFSQIRRPGPGDLKESFPTDERVSSIFEERRDAAQRRMFEYFDDGECSRSPTSRTALPSETNFSSDEARSGPIDCNNFRGDRHTEAIPEQRPRDRDANILGGSRSDLLRNENMSKNWQEWSTPPVSSKFQVGDYLDPKVNLEGPQGEKPLDFVDDLEKKSDLARRKWEEDNKRFLEQWNKGSQKPLNPKPLIDRFPEKDGQLDNHRNIDKDEEIDNLLGNLKNALHNEKEKSKLMNLLQSFSSSGDKRELDKEEPRAFSSNFYQQDSAKAVKRDSEGHFVQQQGYRPKSSLQSFLPTQEPVPETGYIGQHSQGIGGHYEDTFKRRRL